MRKKERIRTKVSKFKVVVSVLLVAMVAVACNIAFVVTVIWRLQGQLKNLYWIAENTHSGVVGWAIDFTEEALDQKLTHLKILAVAMAVLVVSLMISIKLTVSSIRKLKSEKEAKR